MATTIYTKTTADQIRAGDTVKVIENFIQGDDSTITYEGIVQSVSLTGTPTISFNGGTSYAESRSDCEVEIYKVEPPFEFPTLLGSAILAYDNVRLSDRVLILGSGRNWVDPLASTAWSRDDIERSNPRLLHDAGA